ncbi:MAG: hypothetical protein JOZ87_06050 [Chloroflexi bacterium]|nr:hypothetical protein [Chloroflexota bacterium]
MVQQLFDSVAASAVGHVLQKRGSLRCLEMKVPRYADDTVYGGNDAATSDLEHVNASYANVQALKTLP